MEETDIITCLKKRLNEYQNNYLETKNHRCKKPINSII